MELEALTLIDERNLVALVEQKLADDFVACFDELAAIVVIRLVEMLQVLKV